MSAYEYADLAQSLFSNTTAAYAVFPSIVNGYLVTAYLAGAKPTRMQVGILTTLFLAATVIAIFSMTAYAFGGTRLAHLSNPQINEEKVFAAKFWIPTALLIVTTITVAMCLTFMWDVRHPT